MLGIDDDSSFCFDLTCQVSTKFFQIIVRKKFDNSSTRFLGATTYKNLQFRHPRRCAFNGKERFHVEIFQLQFQMIDIH